MKPRPLSVQCPRCGATAGARCTSTAQQYRPGRLDRAHPERTRAAREADERRRAEYEAITSTPIVTKES